MTLTTRLIKNFFDKESVKIKILDLIKRQGFNLKMNEISEKLNISMPLASYHVHGNNKSQGLIGLGLLNKVWNGRLTDYLLEVTKDGKRVLEVLENE